MKVKLTATSLFAIVTFLLGACGSLEERHTPAPVPTAIHWTYEGEEGPAHWGVLDDSYATCNMGKSQSPIDVEQVNEQDLKNISFHYQPSEMNIMNNGHTVQVNYDAGSYIELDSLRYDVVQFHYHAPSEHSVDGKLFDAELHIVHKSADGKLTVVGVLLKAGAQNDAYQPFINNLPHGKSDVKDAGLKINAADLLPSVQTTYRYSGSLTTPPCSEGVNWLLMTTPVELSSQQLDALKSVFEGGNNRPVQPLNDRPLIEDTTP